MSTITPSKQQRPAMLICNRCILDINNDLSQNPCNVAVGHMAKKCHKCANSRHACVLVELPLWPKLKEVNSARAALARSISRGDDEDEQAEREDRARTLGQELIDELKSFDKNRKHHQGDRAVPRKRGAAAAHTGGTDPLLLAEMQSIRRGVLALVEVGKAFLRDRAVPDEQLAAIDAALGPDAPFVESEEDGEEEETGSDDAGSGEMEE